MPELIYDKKTGKPVGTVMYSYKEAIDKKTKEVYKTDIVTVHKFPWLYTNEHSASKFNQLLARGFMYDDPRVKVAVVDVPKVEETVEVVEEPEEEEELIAEEPVIDSEYITCPICNKDFRGEVGLRTHTLRMHKK